MITNYSDTRLVQELQKGNPIFIVEFFPPIDNTNTVYISVDRFNTPLHPFQMEAKKGNIVGNIQCVTAGNIIQPILSYEQYSQVFSNWYHQLGTATGLPLGSIRLSHIGVDTLYDSYKRFMSKYVASSLITFESIDNGRYINICDGRPDMIPIIKRIPELSLYKAGLGTFCEAIKRHFPEMTMSLAGMTWLHDMYTKEFKPDEPEMNLQFLENVTLKDMITTIDNLSVNIPQEAIEDSLMHSKERTEILPFIQYFTQQFQLPPSLSRELLYYQSRRIADVMNCIRGARGMRIGSKPTDRLDLPFIIIPNTEIIAKANVPLEARYNSLV